MEHIKNWIKLILLILLFLIGGFLYWKWASNKLQKSFKQNTNVPQPIEKIKMGVQEINLQPTIQVDKDEIIRTLRIENSRLRNAIATAQPTILTKVSEVRVRIHDTIKDTNVIAVPKYIVLDSPYYHFGFTITKKLFTIDSVSFTNNLSVSFGQKKNESFLDLFRKHPITAEVIVNNPYSTVTKMTSQSYTPKSYSSIGTILKVCLGLGTGYYIGKILK